MDATRLIIPSLLCGPQNTVLMALHITSSAENNEKSFCYYYPNLRPLFPSRIKPAHVMWIYHENTPAQALPHLSLWLTFWYVNSMHWYVYNVIEASVVAFHLLLLSNHVLHFNLWQISVMPLGAAILELNEGGELMGATELSWLRGSCRISYRPCRMTFITFMELPIFRTGLPGTMFGWMFVWKFVPLFFPYTNPTVEMIGIWFIIADSLSMIGKWCITLWLS